MRPKKIRKEEFSTKNHEDAIRSNKNVLSSNIHYDMLRLIFEYLNGMDLANAAMVCRSWLEAANDEKLVRRGPLYTIIHSYFDMDTQRDSLNRLIKELRIKPSVCFGFVNKGAPGLHFENLLPKHCKIIIFYGRHIYTKNKNLKSKMVCTFLPRIPNVTITSFVLPTSCTVQSIVYKEAKRIIFNHKISMPNHETSTCFLFFCNDQNYKIAKCLESIMRESIGNEIIVTYLCQTRLDCCTKLDLYIPLMHVSNNFNKRMKRKNTVNLLSNTPCCIMITGSIQTWVTILRKECNTVEQIEAKLKLFKDEVKLKKHSLGFMFTSMYRQCIHNVKIYDHANLESIIFKRLFPKVPLVGINNYFKLRLSNICDKLNEDRENNIQKEHESESSKFCHYSTIFLILTYG